MAKKYALKSKDSGGFTLMELLVASSLFIIIASIASGAFVQALKTQRNVAAFTAAENNVTQAIEQMAREIRTGSDFSESTVSQLNFTNYKNERVSYRLAPDGTIGRCAGLFCLESTSSFTPITSDKVEIKNLKFFYQGIGEPDNLPPRITISISVEGVKDALVNLQTSVSPYNQGT